MIDLAMAITKLGYFSGANEGQFLSEVQLIWPALMITSSAFQAGASILKVWLLKLSHVVPFAAGAENWYISYDRRLFS